MLPFSGASFSIYDYVCIACPFSPGELRWQQTLGIVIVGRHMGATEGFGAITD